MPDAPRDAERPPSSPASLRALGHIRVLEALYEWGRLSRPDLARRTGLSRATVGSLIADLMAAGILSELGTSRATELQRTGRPARTIGLLPTAAYAVGLDIGHDHVRCVLCDLGGEPVSERRVQLAVDREPDETLACATELVAEAIAGVPHDRILGLGVGIASPINPRTGVLCANAIMPGWVGLRINDELGRRTGLTAHSTNDANAGILGERRYGAAQDCADVTTRSGTPPRYGRDDTAFEINNRRHGAWTDLDVGLRRARAAALLTLALPGTVYIYQADELGLPEVEDIPPDRLQDPTWERSGFTDRGRDGCRVPLPWSGDEPPFDISPAGATDPWLPQPPAWKTLTVQAQVGDPTSTLTLYRRALALRRTLLSDLPESLDGIELVNDVLTIARGNRFVCAVNFAPVSASLPTPGSVLLASDAVDGNIPPYACVWIAR